MITTAEPRANERARAMKKIETLAQKEQWLLAQNEAENAKIEAAKKERSKQKARSKSSKKEEPKP